MQTYNLCLADGEFPVRWEETQLVLLHKNPDNSIDSLSSYRPICLLDTSGKMRERMILVRLNKSIDTIGGLRDRQFSFRRGRSITEKYTSLVSKKSHKQNLV